MVALGTGRNYDIHKVVLVYKSVPISEYADGDVIDVAPAGKDWVSKQGTHGAVVRSRLPNNIWLAKVVLMQGSPAVQQLIALHNLDLLTGMGAGTFEVNNLYGGELVSTHQAWMTQHPPIKYGVQAGVREFEFELVSPKVIGGQALVIA